MAQVGPNSTQVDPKLAPHRLLIAFDCVHVAVCSAKLAPGSLHESPNTGKIAPCVPKLAPRWTKLGPKTAQSRTNTAPSEPKLATSWPQDCMKADISRTYVKPTNSLGKTMIFHHNPIQIPSKSDSNPIQIRSNPIQIRYKPIQSDQVRSKSVPNPIQTGPCGGLFGQIGARIASREPKHRQDSSMCAQVSPKMDEVGAQDGPK